MIRQTFDIIKKLRTKLYRFRHPYKARWVKVGAGPLKGAKLLLDPHAYGGWQAMVNGTFDAELFRALQESVKLSGLTIWDVGAHIGFHSLTFAALVGKQGRVVAFEPNRYNIQRLKTHLAANLELQERITLIPEALSDRDGTSVFVTSSDVDGSFSSGSHLIEAKAPLAPEEYNSFTQDVVKTRRLDTAMKEYNLPIPNVMKIDVEGAEDLLLSGAIELFATSRPLLLIEIHNVVAMLRVSERLRAWSYKIKILDEENAQPSKCFIIASPA